MNQTLNRLKAFGLVFIGSIALPWAVNQLPNINRIINLFPYNDFIRQHLHSILFVLGLLSLLLLSITHLELPPQESDFELRPRKRTVFLENVGSYIAGGLKDKLNRGVQIEVLLEEQPQKVNPTPLALECVDSNTKIKDFFERDYINGKLLILGDAGSGKTIALLTLAQNLIIRAKQDENAGIPVIFELSEWPGGHQSLSSWIVEQLRNRKGFKDINKKVLKQWLSDGIFILLLDGLDELKDSKQASCVNAINKFLEDNPLVKIAVCCRSQTFETLEEVGVSILIRRAVYLQRLKEEQIQQYFRDVKREDLWQTICCNNTNKLDLLEVPLFLDLLASFPPSQGIVNRSSLLDEYIRYKLSLEARKKHYESCKDRKWFYRPGEEPTFHKTLHYLKWLAKKTFRC